MYAVILSVGDELVGGATVDTNSASLSLQLGERGIVVLRHVTVGDEAGAIAAAIAQAAAEAQVVLITGGLGPTADDLTRQALAGAMGLPLREDARSAERIAAFFAARNRPMPPSNRVQAMIPQGAEALDNEVGTAPGIAARVGAAQVFALPGPPYEMEQMFRQHVAPRLPQAGRIVRRVLHTFGAGESDVGEKIADLMARGRNPLVGTTVSAGIVSVRITARSDSGAGRVEVSPAARTGQTAVLPTAEALADRDAAEVRRRLGQIVFGQDDETLAMVVGRALKAARQTLATAESCTGGLIGQLITDIPGASAYFLGGLVCYANQAKTDLLGVPEDWITQMGAVSSPVAGAMAKGARKRFGATWALSATGIAGPAGGTPDKPVGLVFVGLAGPDGTQVHRHVLSGTRDIIRRRAALSAVNHLRLALGNLGG